MVKYAVTVSEMTKRYRRKQVLTDITFQAVCGEWIVIVGKNGCGKSTLLQILSGTKKPDSGTVAYFGTSAGNKGSVYRKYCGYVPQENPLFEALSVRDNLKFWAAGKKQNMQQVIAQFHLEEMLSQKVEKLSGGMQRRLSIACAFLELPPVLILDEPTAALDIYYKESILEWLSEYQSMNGTILMASHEEQEIMRADRCLLMADGKLVELQEDKQLRMKEIRKFFLEK